MTALAQAAIREVEDLHRHFVELFAGRSRDISRCAAAFAAEFEMVTPAGKALDRLQTLALLSAAKAAPDFAITIQSPRVVWQGADKALLQYVEQQYRDGRVTRRLSSALLIADREAPNGVVWRYLHETWMQDAG